MLELFTKIKALVFDIDGVLTDGSVTLMPGGEQIRKMYVKDGYALQLAVKKGYFVAVISGGNSEQSKTRLKGLGIQHIYLKSRNKLDDLREFMAIYNLSSDQVLYMGDDIPDFEVMQKVGLPTCPTDAALEIKNLAKYISPFNGGNGCVRDVIEKVMKVQDQWFDAEQNFSQEFVW